MDQVIIDFLDSVPEPGEGIITRVPANVYHVLESVVPVGTDMMQGVDVYAYSSMITYIDARYQEFPVDSVNYCRSLLSNYLNAMTSVNVAVMYLLFNSNNRDYAEKFRLIVYWNWINVNNLFRNTILPTIYSSTITDVLDLEHIEQTFRDRYPY